jgi:peptidyl-prolyl cis-trans isomerase D
MLDALRKGAATWVAKILFGILVLSFAIWGVGDMLGITRSPPIADVGGTEITGAAFQEAYGRELNRLQRLFNNRVDSEMARQLGVPNRVIQQLVSNRLLSLEAESLGVAISDDLVRQSLRAEPAFQIGDRFDRARFEQILQANNLTEAAFVGQLREDLARAQISGAVREVTKAPGIMVDTFHRYRGERRVAELLLFRRDSVTDIGEPDESALIAYYDANKHLFMAPEYRAITAIVLRPEDLLDEIKLSEQELREAYQSQVAQYHVPERRSVEQILFDGEDAARAAHDRLRQGASFDAVGKNASEAGARVIKIGEVRKEELVTPELSDAVFALAGPGVTEPIQSSVGWHLMRVTAVLPAETKPFEAVRGELEELLGRDKAVESLYGVSTQLDDVLASGAILKEAAQQLNLKLLTVKAVDQQGRDPSGQPVPELPTADNFLTTVFSASEGEDSLLTETLEGGYFVVRVDGVMAPALRPLDVVRDQIVEAWKAEQRTTAAKTEADAIAERMRAGEAVTKIAAERRIEARTSAPFTRDTNNPQGWLPAAVVPALFKAQIDGVEVAPHPDGYVIARLKEIRGVEAASVAAATKELAEQLAGAMAADLETQFDAALRQRYNVTVNRRILETLF